MPADPYAVMSQYYDVFANAAAAVQTAPRADLFASLAAASDRVLDIGSGTGTASLMIADKGCEVHCAEPSPAMRAIHLAKLAGRPDLAGRVTVVPLESGFPAPVDYVYSAGVLQCLSGADRRAMFAAAAAALRPGGILALDMVGDTGDTEDATAQPFPPTLIAKAAVGRCDYEMWLSESPAARHAVDHHTVTQEFEYRVYLEGRIIERAEVSRTVFRNERGEISRELRGIGFTVAQGQPEWPRDFLVAHLAE